jgi:hypothetical protein
VRSQSGTAQQLGSVVTIKKRDDGWEKRSTSNLAVPFLPPRAVPRLCRKENGKLGIDKASDTPFNVRFRHVLGMPFAGQCRCRGAAISKGMVRPSAATPHNISAYAKHAVRQIQASSPLRNIVVLYVYFLGSLHLRSKVSHHVSGPVIGSASDYSPRENTNILQSGISAKVKISMPQSPQPRPGSPPAGEGWGQSQGYASYPALPPSCGCSREFANERWGPQALSSTIY